MNEDFWFGVKDIIYAYLILYILNEIFHKKDENFHMMD